MKKESIIVLLYPGCISFEVALAAELLSKKYHVVNASPDGEDLSDASGLPLKVQVSYENVSLKNCAAILVPGGNPDSIVKNEEIDEILIEANKKDLVIGAICAGPSVLAKAGILKGRKIAHGYGEKQLAYLKDLFKRVQLTDEPFVVDDHIVTAKPDAYIDFAVELAGLLGVVEESKKRHLKKYYRGTLGKKKIRALALALITNKKGQLLLHQAHDSVKDETFYRPLGGGIDFHETGEKAVKREIDEELGLKVKVRKMVGAFENIFVYEGEPGHEIVLVYEAEFKDAKVYKTTEFKIIESGRDAGKAVWRSVEEIGAEDANLYPKGLAKALGLRKPQRK